MLISTKLSQLACLIYHITTFFYVLISCNVLKVYFGVFYFHLMQVLCIAIKLPAAHPHIYLTNGSYSIYMCTSQLSFLLLLVGCVLHSSIPLPCSGRSFGPWSHSTWSFGWDCLLPETRLVQTWRSTGIHFLYAARLSVLYINIEETQDHGLWNFASIILFVIGVDWCWHSDFFLLCHRTGRTNCAGQLQPLPQQLLPVSLNIYTVYIYTLYYMSVRGLKTS